jgi:hypothetical protein
MNMMHMLVQPAAKPAEAQPSGKTQSTEEEGASHPFAAILQTAHSSMANPGSKKDKGGSPPQTSPGAQTASPAPIAQPVHNPQFLELPSFSLAPAVPAIPLPIGDGQPAAAAGSGDPTQPGAAALIAELDASTEPVTAAALAEPSPGTDLADSLATTAGAGAGASAGAGAGAGASAGTDAAAGARRSAAEARGDGRTPDPQTILAPAKAPASPSTLQPANPLLAQKDPGIEPKHQTALATASPSPAGPSKIAAPGAGASRTTGQEAPADASTRNQRTTGARSPNVQSDATDGDASLTAAAPRPAAMDPSQLSVPTPGGDAKDVTVVNGPSSPAAATTPDASAPAPHAAAASVANQAVLRRVASGEIQDPELGRVAVRAAGSNASIDVAVSVDRADTHFALHSSSGAMAADLRQAEVPLGQLRLERSQATLADTAGNGHGAFAQDTPRDSHSSPEAEEADDTTPAATAGRVRIVL